MGCVSERTFTIRRGDTLPKLRLLLTDDEENVPDLTGATGILELWEPGQLTAPTISAAAALFQPPVVDALSGRDYNCEYAWVVANTDRPPITFKGEVEVTFPGGGKATFPSRRQDRFNVKIEAD